MPSTYDYRALIPNYNAVQPNYVSVLTALLQPLADLQTALSAMPAAFDLDYAVGVQLDQVGLWIGRNRDVDTPIEEVYFSWDTDNLGWDQGYWQGAFDPGTGITELADDPYRQVLYAKAAANHWDGSYLAIYDILSNLMLDQGVQAQVYDNMDMTMNVTIVGTFNDQVLKYLLMTNGIPIKPEGVAITYTFSG